MLEHGHSHPMRMPPPFDGYGEKPARLSRTCPVYRWLATATRCRGELFGQVVSTRLYPAGVVAAAEDHIVARHGHQATPARAQQRSQADQVEIRRSVAANWAGANSLTQSTSAC
ncbi:hypothetical protein OKW40_005720 [Paraburkholderia sp. RAU6.4a]